MTLHVFVVFHKVMDERLILSPFSVAEVERYFTMYAVSERYPHKVATRIDGETIRAVSGAPRVIVEQQLSVYDPVLQVRGFMETSCYVHLLKDNLHTPFDYVGVTQYDMRWTPAAAAIVREIAAVSPSSTAYGVVCGELMDGSGRFNPMAAARLGNWDFLLESYNRFFGQRWDRSIFVGKPLTLFQTYILPQAEFAAMAS